MLNKSNTKYTEEKRAFVEGLASILAPCDIPLTAARLYGYLLVSEEPVSLDQIAADLGVSKSGACTAAQLLERMHSARRYAEPGTNRVLYGASDNNAGPLAEQSALFTALAKHMQTSGSKAASGVALKRVRMAAKFFFAMRDALDSVTVDFEAVESGSDVERD